MMENLTGEYESAWFQISKKDALLTTKSLSQVLSLELLIRQATQKRDKPTLGKPLNTTNMKELTMLEMTLPLNNFSSLVAAITFFQRDLPRLEKEVERIASRPSYTLVFPRTLQNEPRHRQSDREWLIKNKFQGSQNAIEFIREEIYQKYHF